VIARTWASDPHPSPPLRAASFQVLVAGAPNAAVPNDGPEVKEMMVVNPFHDCRLPVLYFASRGNRMLTAQIIYFLNGRMRIKNVFCKRITPKMRLNEENKIMKPDSRNKPVAPVEPPRIKKEIRKRAYELFEARGREEGHDLEDWFRAEKEITGRKSDVAAA
jgi:Protein of unknown function (DUF2934)